MYEYLVYLMEHGVYTERVKCKSQDEADIVIDEASRDDRYEKYLLIVRDVKLDMPVQMETDYFSAINRKRSR